MRQDFLVEIGTEELPPTSLKTLSDAFTAGVEKRIHAFNLGYVSAKAYATPRRLAVLIEGLDEATPVREEKVWGAPAKVAFDADGKPSKAAIAFAKKNGIEPTDLKVENDGKQDKLVHLRETGGEKTTQLIGQIVNDSLAELPIAKRMRWGSSRNEFVRPVKWVVLLFGDQIIEETILGITASNISRGHRFHCEHDLVIEQPCDYEKQLLEQGHVQADYEVRKTTIREQVNELALSHKAQAVIDEDLLDEVTALVEWPTALCGAFENEFLSVPAEALISSMKEHQKYFHLVDDSGSLIPRFITVSNIISTDPEKIIDGNERVIRPRLADAKFFFDTDRKTTLASRREKLKSVVFQAKLGTIFDKTERIGVIAQHIANALNVDTKNISRAAQLCKSDLVSNMVYEFTDLQGIAGYHYALNDGENDEIAKAMDEQYMPRFAGDDLPTTETGAILALADRLDTITGIFGIGQKPTGSKDPFALRRASLGALRILVEKKFDLDLRELVTVAANTFAELPKKDSVVEDVLQYMLDRFKSWYEEEGITAEVFQSVAAKNLSVPLDINNRIFAVAEFTRLPEAQALAAANKRVSNILAKQTDSSETTFDSALLSEAAEIALSKKVEELATTVKPLVEKRAYTESLTFLSQLREPVDTFFNDVMVMTEDQAVKNNRLALLAKLRNLFLDVADISYLAIKGEN